MNTTPVKCEWCAYAISGKHYSLPECNDSGYGVALHYLCALTAAKLPLVLRQVVFTHLRGEAIQ